MPESSVGLIPSFVIESSEKKIFEPPRTLSLQGVTSLVGFGDSIALGFDKSVTDHNEATNIDYGFLFVIAAAKSISLTNFGAGGTSLEDNDQIGLIRSTTFNQTHAIAFMPGTNDAAENGLDADYLKLYRKLLVEAIHKMSVEAKCVFMATPPKQIEFESNPFVTDDVLSVYSEILKDVVRQLQRPNVVLVDVFHDFPNNHKTKFDHVHPNMDGSDLIAYLFTKRMT